MKCDPQKKLFTIVVRCVDDAKAEQEAGQLLFAVRNSCLFIVLLNSTACMYSHFILNLLNMASYSGFIQSELTANCYKTHTRLTDI